MDDRKWQLEIEKLRADFVAIQEESNDRRRSQMAQWRAELEADRDHYRAKLESALEHVRAANGFAQIGLNNLVLLSGGAAVALLAFVGTSKNPATAVKSMTLPLSFLAAGATLAILAAAFAFFSQDLYAHSDGGDDAEKTSRGHSSRLLAILLSGLGLLSTISGGIIAFRTMVQ